MPQAPKILLLYAHPYPSKSVYNRKLINAVTDLEHVTVRRLYELYPNFQINAVLEQQLLVEHDVIIFQYPMYWYSAPALVKEWLDTVLQYGFAYGRGGKALNGKQVQSVITMGSNKEDYDTDGLHHFTIDELLRPFEQTIRLCDMLWQPPRVLSGCAEMDAAILNSHCRNYREHLQHYSLEKEATNGT